MKKSFSLSSKFIVCSKQLSGLRDSENEQKESEVVARCVQNKGEIHSQTVLVPFFEEHLFKWYSWVEERVWGCIREWKKVSVKGWWEFSLAPVKCLVYISFESTQFYSFKRAALCACYCSNLTEFQFPLSLALSAVFSPFNRFFYLLAFMFFFFAAKLFFFGSLVRRNIEIMKKSFCYGFEKKLCIKFNKTVELFFV